MNSVCLLGRMVANPEMRRTPNGVSICSFRIAVNRTYKNRNGGYDSDFINCIAWRKTGEFIHNHFEKGDSIAVHGSIQTRQYQDRKGTNRTAFEIVVDDAYFTGEKRAPREYNEPRNNFSTARIDDFQPLAADENDLPF